MHSNMKGLLREIVGRYGDQAPGAAFLGRCCGQAAESPL